MRFPVHLAVYLVAALSVTSAVALPEPAVILYRVCCERADDGKCTLWVSPPENCP